MLFASEQGCSRDKRLLVCLLVGEVAGGGNKNLEFNFNLSKAAAMFKRQELLKFPGVRILRES